MFETITDLSSVVGGITIPPFEPPLPPGPPVNSGPPFPGVPDPLPRPGLPPTKPSWPPVFERPLSSAMG